MASDSIVNIADNEKDDIAGLGFNPKPAIIECLYLITNTIVPDHAIRFVLPILRDPVSAGG
jgi:hypothetical protein